MALQGHGGQSQMSALAAFENHFVSRRQASIGLIPGEHEAQAAAVYAHLVERGDRAVLAQLAQGQLSGLEELAIDLERLVDLDDQPRTRGRHRRREPTGQNRQREHQQP